VWPWPLTFWPQGQCTPRVCHGLYFTDFNDSSSCFPFNVWPDKSRQTKWQMQLIANHTYSTMTANVQQLLKTAQTLLVIVNNIMRKYEICDRMLAKNGTQCNKATGWFLPGERWAQERRIWLQSQRPNHALHNNITRNIHLHNLEHFCFCTTT